MLLAIVMAMDTRLMRAHLHSMRTRAAKLEHALMIHNALGGSLSSVSGSFGLIGPAMLGIMVEMILSSAVDGRGTVLNSTDSIAMKPGFSPLCALCRAEMLAESPVSSPGLDACQAHEKCMSAGGGGVAGPDGYKIYASLQDTPCHVQKRLCLII
eukprot:4149302-Amphidinium_carterae.1